MMSLWIAIGILAVFGLIFGLILVMPHYVLKLKTYCWKLDDFTAASVVNTVIRGAAYAEAVANGEMINKCAPGGEQVMLKIAELMNVDPQPIDGDEEAQNPVRKVAVIDEENCIGLHQMYSSLPCGCHCGRHSRYAYRDWRFVYRLWPVCSPLPYGLYWNGTG